MVLESYTNEELGIRGMVPVGWTELEPGIFARANTALDEAAFQMAADPTRGVEQVLSVLTESYGLEERPGSTGERQANGLTWSLYTLEAQGLPRDVALAQGATLMILRSPIEERGTLYETVFLPMVDSLVPAQ